MILNTLMQFEEYFKQFILEKKEEPEAPVPYVIEITKDDNRGRRFNDLGDLIIKLSQLRSRL